MGDGNIGLAAITYPVFHLARQRVSPEITHPTSQRQWALTSVPSKGGCPDIERALRAVVPKVKVQRLGDSRATIANWSAGAGQVALFDLRDVPRDVLTEHMKIYKESVQEKRWVADEFGFTPIGNLTLTLKSSSDHFRLIIIDPFPGAYPMKPPDLSSDTR